MLLDATDKLAAPNVLPYRALNWKGRMIAENGGSGFINLYPKAKSKTVVNLMATMDEKGNLSGGCRNVITNNRALVFRKRYRSKGKEKYIETMENKHGSMVVTDFKATDVSNVSKPVQESFKFNIENQADVIGDKIYFSPLFHLRQKENPFKLEKREFPLDFGYPTTTSYRISITIPETHKVDASIVSPVYYSALKEYYNTFIQKEAEQIVLTKL
jgi:hypothetical protein